MCLLIVVNRVCGSDEGGVFSLGHAVGQLMLTIGTFEVRNFQSTDIKEQFKFEDYMGFRIISCIVMAIASFGYVFISGYTAHKAAVALLLCFYRGVDAFSDVFQGAFQQKDRIDIAGKILCLKVVLSSVIFALAILLTENLIISLIFMNLVATLCCVLYDVRITRMIENIKCSFSKNAIVNIFKECAPLFVGAFVVMYIVNEPKYAIDVYLTPEKQNVFAIVFMPAFVVNLFSLFIFRPMITTLAIAWEDKKINIFLKLIGKALCWCTIITVMGVVGAAVLGIPILEMLYGIELKEYKLALLIIMVGGGGNAISTVLRYTLTVVREQYKTLWAYCISLVLTLALASILVPRYKVVGASLLYTISMFIMSIVLVIILGVKIIKTSATRKNGQERTE